MMKLCVKKNIPPSAARVYTSWIACLNPLPTERITIQSKHRTSVFQGRMKHYQSLSVQGCCLYESNNAGRCLQKYVDIQDVVD